MHYYGVILLFFCQIKIYGYESKWSPTIPFFQSSDNFTTSQEIKNYERCGYLCASDVGPYICIAKRAEWRMVM